MNINKIVFAGNITRDPELKSLPTGTKVVNFSIASNSKYKNKNGEMVEQTEFGNIVMFDKKAEAVAKYLKKGDPIYVEGKLQTRSWEKDGVKMYRTEINPKNRPLKKLIPFNTPKKKLIYRISHFSMKNYGENIRKF